jgi:CxxC motif-containing protein (DUF1111 family)
MKQYGRVLAAMALIVACCQAQTDPGPRGGAPGAGQPFKTLTPGELDFFTNHGLPQFTQVEAVSDGLGPRFNLNSCGGCHVQPAFGGSSPAVNPQFALAPTMAPGNTVPSFITPNGPVREARFVQNSNGSADGGVHDVFTIRGRTDAPAGCAIQQPDFATQQHANNVIFRIPTPVFGSGLIEAITDTTLSKNLASDPGGLKASLGIKGHLNTNGNDGTITRFGWKAQNKSLLIFSGEAYNVEMGVTNENFQTEREEDPHCNAVPTPNSVSDFQVGSTGPSDILSFMGFMKFLDQPKPVASYGKVTAASILNGSALFVSTGCALCHTPSLTTGSNASASLTNVKANLFSDLAVHHMGEALADRVTQGSAGPDEFRTAPLWGLGQRLFFLHDGRTSDLMDAIQAHSSSGECGFLCQFVGGTSTPPSEANEVIERFNALSPSQKQDILNFLRSL